MNFTLPDREFRDPQSERLDAGKLGSFFEMPIEEVARAVRFEPRALQHVPDAVEAQASLSELYRVAAALLSVFRTPERARLWLKAPHPDLDGVAPIELVRRRKVAVVAELLEDALLGHPG